MGLTVSGLASGLDTDAIIDQLLAVQRRRIRLLEARSSREQQRADALTELKTKLSTLQSKAANLNDLATLQAKRAATDTPSTEPAVVEVSADASAVLGAFRVTVVQLATSTSVTSTAAVGQPIDPGVTLGSAGFATTPTTGTFTINGVSISVDPTVDTLNDVIARINGSGAGVTASLSGNKLSITANDGITPVQLGSGADTSNFLTVTKLAASPSGTTRTSTGNLGVVLLGQPLDSARLAKSIGSGAGAFKINGVQIDFDTTTDSLSDVLTRINNSSAGVNATYDSATDTVTLTQKETGSTAIALEYVSGPDLLDGLNLKTAPQSLGQNAQITIDNGSGPITYYSTSNTVTDAVAGVTIKLLRESATAVNVTVSQDSDAILGAVKEFVEAYNAAADYLRAATKIDPKGDGDGVLAGDGGLGRIAASLRSIVTGGASGDTGTYTTFAQIGLSFGAVGSNVGSTETLVLDETKFLDALAKDPDSVALVFSASSGTQTGITRRLEAYLTDYTKYSGILDQRADTVSDRIADIADQIERMEDRLDAQETLLRNKFTLLETSLARLQGAQASLASGLAGILGRG